MNKYHHQSSPLKGKFVLFLIVFVVTLSSCNKGGPVSSADDLLPGFSMLPNPNSLDKPGTIFYIDDDNKPQILGTLPDVEIQSGTVVLGSLSGSRKTSLNSVLEFVGIKEIDLSASVNTNKSINFNVSVSGTDQERIGLLQAKQSITKNIEMIRELFEELTIGSTEVYLITEAVKASKLSYEFDKSIDGDGSLDTEIIKIVENNSELSWKNTSNYQLGYDLKTQLYVFTKVYRMNIKAGLTGTDISLGSVVNSENLYN